MVKRQTRKLAGHLCIALHHSKLIGCKKLANHMCQLGRSVRRELTGLEHHAVASGHGGNGGAQSQLQRIVPGRDDAYHPQRLALDARRGRQQVQWCPDPARLHPACQVSQGMGQHGA